MIKEKLDYISRPSRMCKLTCRPTTYTIHETQNYSAYSQNERDNLQNNSGTTSFHSVVDHEQVVRCIPFNKGANHSGTARGNSTSISLEICSSSLQKQFLQTWNNAIEVVAHDLILLGLTADDLRMHFDWSGKDCPKYIRSKNLFPSFKKEVSKRMAELKEPVKCSFPDDQKWVKEMGISDGSNPKEPVTREQVWAMLHRAYQKGVFK